jgi:hypothetical protein
MDSSYWREKAQAELLQAETARQARNEGKARVCARRAAGHIAGEYLARQGIPPRSASAIVRLQRLATLPGIDPQVRATAEHFLVRITPDHKLPMEADLISEARWLAMHLLGEPIDNH